MQALIPALYTKINILQKKWVKKLPPLEIEPGPSGWLPSLLTRGPVIEFEKNNCDVFVLELIYLWREIWILNLIKIKTLWFDPKLILRIKKLFPMPSISLKEGVCIIFLWINDYHLLFAFPNQHAKVFFNMSEN